ncbi:hypothetical protein REPUB_Repub01dG0188800 [Reevesia pubescens]
MVGHLFFSCEVSWCIWFHFYIIWNLTWVNHQDPLACFLSWQFALSDISCNKAWQMAFFAIAWLIWLYRNDIVFKGKILVFD